jgi:hypothetical protein
VYDCLSSIAAWLHLLRRCTLRCRVSEKIILFSSTMKIKLFSIKISMKFLYNFSNKKNYAKRVIFSHFYENIYCALFFSEKKLKKWATRGLPYSAQPPPEVCIFFEKGPVEALFGLVWGGYPLILIKKGAKNDWIFVRPKKKCFLKVLKMHIFSVFWGSVSLIGVDMIPVTPRGNFHFFMKK